MTSARAGFLNVDRPGDRRSFMGIDQTTARNRRENPLLNKKEKERMEGGRKRRRKKEGRGGRERERIKKTKFCNFWRKYISEQKKRNTNFSLCFIF